MHAGLVTSRLDAYGLMGDGDDGDDGDNDDDDTTHVSKPVAEQRSPRAKLHAQTMNISIKQASQQGGKHPAVLVPTDSLTD